MKLRTVIFLMIFSLLCSFANADEVTHRAAAEEFLLLTNADKILKPMLEQMAVMMKQQFVQMGAPEELRPVLNKYSRKLLKVMEEEFEWGKIKNDYIDIYVKTFTEKEIREISDFYKSPIGKKYVEKIPQLMQESMAISQKFMPIFIKKTQKIREEMDSEIKLLKEHKKSKGH